MELWTRDAAAVGKSKGACSGVSGLCRRPTKGLRGPIFGPIGASIGAITMGYRPDLSLARPRTRVDFGASIAADPQASSAMRRPLEQSPSAHPSAAACRNAAGTQCACEIEVSVETRPSLAQGKH